LGFAVRTLLALLVIVCAPVAAQNPYGRITGRVRDSAGAVVPGASLHVRNVETGVAIAGRSNDEGNYDVPNLNPGSYRILVEMPGFKRYDRGPLEVRLGDVLSVDIALELGAVTEQVVVTADTPLLDAAGAGVGQVVDHQRLVDMPLPSGNPMYLLQMAPGTFATTAPTVPWLPNAIDNASGMGGSGTRARMNEMTLDGVPNMTQNGQVSFIPPPEMIQEVRVQTAPVDASIGHFSGASVNMAVRTGTNTLHGDLFFSHLSRPLMARDFFTNRAIYDTRTGPVTKSKIDTYWPYTRVNHYRGAVGGPVRIPGVYDGRNRTFWMLGVDTLTRIRAEHGTYTVPTAAERSGDFSALLALGSQYQIYDPATVQPAPNGRFSRQPLAGNLIPASRIDPLGRKLAGYYPLPNITGGADGTSNYYDPLLRTGPYYGYIGRFDRTVNENNRFYTTLSHSATDVKWNQATHNEASGQLLDRRHFGLAVDDVHVLRPNLVLEVRGGVTRYIYWTRPVSFGTDVSSLGFSSALARQLDPAVTAFPQITVNAFEGLGGTSGSDSRTNYYNFSGTVSQMRSSHNLRYGGEFRVLQENSYDYGNVAPALTFNAGWTKGPLDNAAAAPIGQGLASLLFGLPTAGSVDVNASYAQQSRYAALFVQDEWKAARRLTVSAGLRWELELPLTERYNRTTRGFDFSTPNPVEPAAVANYAKAPMADLPASQFHTPGGLLFAGAGGQPRGTWTAKNLQFAPRVGLAFAARPDTVMRAGYAIFYDTMGADRSNVMQQGFNQTTTLQPSLDNGMTFQASLANPFPNGWLAPAGSASGLGTYVGRGPGFFWPWRHNGYMQRWMLGVQRQIRRVLVEAAYVGNRGTRLGVARDFDAVPARYLSASPVRDAAVINDLTRAVANPFLDIPQFAGGGLQGKTVQRQQLLLPFPHFTALTSTLDGGLSWYHALQVRFEKRFSRAFTLHGAYTFSKFMEAVDLRNDTDPYPEHVVSPHDRPHVLAISGIYELPFFRRRIAGGWTLQGIYQAQSGPPLEFGNVLFYGDIKSIPLPVAQRTAERWFNIADFEKQSGKQLAQNIRVFPSRFNNVRGDGFNNFNLSLFKNFRLSERARLQVRAEAIDALNHAMFDTPGMNVTGKNFGVVTAVAGAQQRQISLGAKLRW
jgi:hypothetical protein